MNSKIGLKSQLVSYRRDLKRLSRALADGKEKEYLEANILKIEEMLENEQLSDFVIKLHCMFLNKIILKMAKLNI